MGYLFQRDMAISIGPIKVPMRLPGINPFETQESLKATFKIEKTLKSEPNKASIKIYNLSKANRNVIKEGAATGLFPLVVEAGYIDNMQQIFTGSVENAESNNEGVDWITGVEAKDDGGKKYRSVRVNESFGPGTPLVQLLTKVAAALKIGLGNSALKFASSQSGVTVFKKGVTVRGRASDVLDKYVATLGYNWSIQDGQLQILGPKGDETLLGQMVILNKFTGLVGTPEKIEKGGIKARSLLQGLICPGRRVQVITEEDQGQYRAEKVIHLGDSRGQDWYSDFEAQEASPL